MKILWVTMATTCFQYSPTECQRSVSAGVGVGIEPRLLSFCLWLVCRPLRSHLESLSPSVVRETELQLPGSSPRWPVRRSIVLALVSARSEVRLTTVDGDTSTKPVSAASAPSDVSFFICLQPTLHKNAGLDVLLILLILLLFGCIFFLSDNLGYLFLYFVLLILCFFLVQMHQRASVDENSERGLCHITTSDLFKPKSVHFNDENA